LQRDAATACALLTQHIERTASNIALMLEQSELSEARQSPLPATADPRV
jgi:hypothetical protein